MKHLLLPALLISVATLLSCSENKAAELYDTAQLEEKQNNKEHAVQLYKEIMNKYPESPYAGNAAERLADMCNDGGPGRTSNK
jgi:outer membrane protein assembly factor BamD (BamD/ComL family)